MSTTAKTAVPPVNAAFTSTAQTALASKPAQPVVYYSRTGQPLTQRSAGIH